MEKEQFNLFDYVSSQGVQVLSLFDGMACGMLAMLESGIKVDRYVAYEIDKYAVQTSMHNFPMIEQRGDVFKADFTEFKGFDYLIGGSPCTYWSIAQKNNRETEASGMGWELFSQYVRALHEAKPKYFVYENNKSMSKAIRASIDEAFGFEAVYINSALVSAQNRQRLYWVGKRNEDGTYSKVDVKQPGDRGVLLKDILEGGEAWQDKAFAYTTRCQAAIPHDTFEKHRHTMVAEPVASAVLNINPSGKGMNGSVSHINAKSRCLTTNKGEGQKIIVPVGIGYRGRIDNGKWVKQYEANGTEKANALTTAQTDSMVAEPCRVGTYPNNAKNQESHDSQQYRIYSTDGKGVTLCGNGGGLGAKTGLYAIPVEQTDITPFVEARIPKAIEKYGYLPTMWNPYNNAEITDKAPTQTAQCASQTKSATVMIVCYATPCEWDENGKPTKAISATDGKTYIVYEVKDGLITIKGKQYPIKLADGFYIIRKLTVKECMRLQTVPEWYEFPVSDSQAYKMLGNGWTVSAISHLLNATK